MSKLARTRTLIAAAGLLAIPAVATSARDRAAEHAQSVGNHERTHQRTVRVDTLRGLHAVAASQPMLIHAMIQAHDLTGPDRAEVNEKLQIFQIRLDEAANAIESLELVEPGDSEPGDWETRDAAATRALERVEDAREDAWEALLDADRIEDRTSTR